MTGTPIPLLSHMLDVTMNSSISTQVPRISSLPRCVWQEPDLPGMMKLPKFRGIQVKVIKSFIKDAGIEEINSVVH